MEELRQDIRRMFSALSVSISTDYIEKILEEIENDIIKDVVVCSSYETDGLYNDDDIRMAIGRVLMDRMGIFC